jgi:hypothetical protein
VSASSPLSLPLTYQWYNNGTQITGATGSSYTITNVIGSNNGNQFTVIVKDSLNQSTTSAVALLTVTGGTVSIASLTAYLQELRWLLHDTTSSFWPDAELTYYINQARHRVCQDTKCLRQLVTGLTLTAGQENYNINSFMTSVAGQVVDIMNIYLYWGNARYPLQYMDFSNFSAQLRQWQLYQTTPGAWTRMGGTNFYVAPIPDQAYVVDIDCAINCTDLANQYSVESIPIPFQEPVKFWAAYLAKFKEQSMGEAMIFKKEYVSSLMMCSRAFQTRIIPNIFAR